MDIEVYDTYAEAAERATSLARSFRTAIQVRPNGPVWEVALPFTYGPKLYSSSSEDGSGSVEDEPFEDDQDREDRIEELRDTQDNWARSDEDGWFYPDDE